MAGVSSDVADRLYAGSPDGFVAARAEAVAAAKAAGDAAAAKAIGALRKPTVAAWLVNLLAIRRPDLVSELVELSASLRAAQRELRGPKLRELSAQRRGAVSALVAQARELAMAEAPDVAAGKLPLAEVEATFNAAMSDADVAEQVRSGRLVRAATYAGFGEVPRPQLRLITADVEEAEEPEEAEEREAAPRDKERAAERSRKSAEAARAAQRRALEKELAKARTEHERAEVDLERAAAAERESAEALAEIEEALADLERRRADAEQEVSRRKLARKTAERAVSAARRRMGEAEGAVEGLAEEDAAK
jgi:chromosome segregation ATPase